VAKGVVSIAGMIFIGAFIIAILFIAVNVPYLNKAVKIRSDANIYMEINDQPGRVLSFLKTKKDTSSFMENIGYEISGDVLASDISEGMQSLANEMDIMVSFRKKDGSEKKYGDRTSGDMMFLEAPLPGGFTRTLRIVTESIIPSKTGIFGGNLDYVVRVARNEVGEKTTETGMPSDCLLGNLYGSKIGGVCYDWCCFFATWVYREAGFSKIPHEGGSWNMWEWFSRNGMTTSDPKDAAPGSMVFWKRPGERKGHTGIVVENTGTQIKTVEGNQDCDGRECVKEKTYTYAQVLNHFDGLLGFGWIQEASQTRSV